MQAETLLIPGEKGNPYLCKKSLYMKYIILAAIVFVVYRFFIKPAALPDKKEDSKSKAVDEGDYIDYEEVD